MLQVCSSMGQPQPQQMIAKIAVELFELKEKKLLRKLGIPEAFAAAVKKALEELSQGDALHSSAASQAAGQPESLATTKNQVNFCSLQCQHHEIDCKPLSV